MHESGVEGVGNACLKLLSPMIRVPLMTSRSRARPKSAHSIASRSESSVLRAWIRDVAAWVPLIPGFHHRRWSPTCLPVSGRVSCCQTFCGSGGGTPSYAARARRCARLSALPGGTAWTAGTRSNCPHAFMASCCTCDGSAEEASSAYVHRDSIRSLSARGPYVARMLYHQMFFQAAGVGSASCLARCAHSADM